MIILVYGRLEQAIKDKVISLKSHFYEKFDSSKLNCESFDFDQGSEGVEMSLLSPPFLSDKKMIIVNNFLTNSQNETEELLEIMSRLPKDVILVLTGVIGVKDLARRKVYKFFSGNENVHEYQYDEGRQVYGDFLNKYLQAKGLSLSFSQKESLIGYVDSIQQMKNLLDQIALFRNDSDFDEVFMKLVPAVDSIDVFKIIDALQAGNLAKARSILDVLRASGVAEQQIQAMWSNQISYMIAICEAERNTDLAERMGIHPFVAKKLMSAVRGFSESSLRAMHDDFVDISLNAKNLRLSPELLTDKLLFGASMS